MRQITIRGIEPEIEQEIRKIAKGVRVQNQFHFHISSSICSQDLMESSNSETSLRLHPPANCFKDDAGDSTLLNSL